MRQFKQVYGKYNSPTALISPLKKRRKKAIKDFEQSYRDVGKVKTGEYDREKREFYYDKKRKDIFPLPTDDADRTITTGIKKKNLGENFKSPIGKKDACYHKVKRRYKVFPSAYASGAISKCRKVGAANWGNKKK